MMEKKRLLSEGMTETDKHFLERTGVGVQIREVLTKVIENRPEDPVSFLADFFEGQGGSQDRVAKANQLLLTAHHTKPAYLSNVRAAYDVMSFHKNLDKHGKMRKKEKGKQLKGVTGLNFMELVYLLIQEFPSKVKDEVIKKMRCRDHEVIPYDLFQSAVFTCLVLKEFLQQAKALYKSLDTGKNDKVDKVVCETLNLHLYKAVNTDSTDPASILEAGSLLGPEKTYSNLATAMFNSKTTKQYMSCDEFLMGAAESFLSKVKRLQ